MAIRKCAICDVEQKQFTDEKGAKTRKEKIHRCSKCNRYVCAFCIQEVEIFTSNVSDLNKSSIYSLDAELIRETVEEVREGHLHTIPITKKVCIECLGLEGA